MRDISDGARPMEWSVAMKSMLACVWAWAPCTLGWGMGSVGVPAALRPARPPPPKEGARATELPELYDMTLCARRPPACVSTLSALSPVPGRRPTRVLAPPAMRRLLGWACLEWTVAREVNERAGEMARAAAEVSMPRAGMGEAEALSWGCIWDISISPGSESVPYAGCSLPVWEPLKGCRCQRIFGEECRELRQQ